jgi:Mn-dependent DtxR family transcriptional regulator
VKKRTPPTHPRLQQDVLKFIKGCPNLTTIEIATFLDIHPYTRVHNAIFELRRKGLVESSPKRKGPRKGNTWRAV